FLQVFEGVLVLRQQVLVLLRRQLLFFGFGLCWSGSPASLIVLSRHEPGLPPTKYLRVKNISYWDRNRESTAGGSALAHAPLDFGGHGRGVPVSGIDQDVRLVAGQGRFRPVGVVEIPLFHLREHPGRVLRRAAGFELRRPAGCPDGQGGGQEELVRRLREDL